MSNEEAAPARFNDLSEAQRAEVVEVEVEIRMLTSNGQRVKVRDRMSADMLDTCRVDGMHLLYDTVRRRAVRALNTIGIKGQHLIGRK